MLPFMGGMMTAGSPAALPTAISLGASLDTTGSTSSITSAAVTVTVPAGNSGIIIFQNLTDIGNGGSLRWRRNSGVFQLVIEGDGDGFSNADTITLSVAACASVGDGASVDLIDQSTGTKIGTYHLYRV